MRIGFTGVALAGKDVAAQALVQHRGFVMVNMSSALRRDLEILDPYIRLDASDGDHFIRVSHALQVYTYDELKAVSDDFRTLLQRYGTDVWRSVDENVWVRRAAEAASHHDNVVTTGVRFVNEIEGIDWLVHVDRPGYGPVNDHVSDSGMQDVIDRANFRLDNIGTEDELQLKTILLYEHLLTLTPSGS